MDSWYNRTTENVQMHLKKVYMQVGSYKWLTHKVNSHVVIKKTPDMLAMCSQGYSDRSGTD